MPSYPHDGVHPVLGEGVFLVPSAVVFGDVTLGDDVSFWFRTVARYAALKERYRALFEGSRA